MAGLRERKKRETRTAIHDAAMKLFATQGFGGTTIDEIAEAANVSRATVFTYFPTKEEIVFGEGAAAIEDFATRLRERPEGVSTVDMVRGWLEALSGWFEAELVLQMRLAREVPAVGARRLQLHGEAERAIASRSRPSWGRVRSWPRGSPPRRWSRACASRRRPRPRGWSRRTASSPSAEVTALLDGAVAFAEAGIAAISSR